jgi:hypothetical protein
MDAIDKLPYDATKELEFRVLTKLANVAAQDGTRAFRFIPEMSNELGVSERSIFTALRGLQDKHLIRKGDQKVLSSWRGDKRPTVWDINMRAWESLTEVPDTLSDGVKEISTGSDGVKYGMNADFNQGELREQLNSTTQNNNTDSFTPSASLRCSAPGQNTHRFDPLSGWCPCGVRSDALTGA